MCTDVHHQWCKRCVSQRTSTDKANEGPVQDLRHLPSQVSRNQYGVAHWTLMWRVWIRKPPVVPHSCILFPWQVVERLKMHWAYTLYNTNLYCLWSYHIFVCALSIMGIGFMYCLLQVHLPCLLQVHIPILKLNMFMSDHWATTEAESPLWAVAHLVWWAHVFMVWTDLYDPTGKHYHAIILERPWECKTALYQETVMVAASVMFLLALTMQ